MACEITIRNCKNIDEGTFSIEKNKLNVKFAPNGTGKTALADGLRCGIEKDEHVGARITPFKYRNLEEPPMFEIDGISDLESVMLFDDEYVRNIIYADNALFPESFDVFIKTNEYLETVESIENKFEKVLAEVSSSDITDFQSTLETLITNTCGGGGLSKDGTLKASAPSIKGMSKGNFKKDIPPEYESLSCYIDSDDFSKWARWHKDGELFLEKNTHCPFCGGTIVDSKETLLAIKDQYPSANVNNYDKFTSCLILSMEYFSDETKKELAVLLDSCVPLNAQQQSYLSEVANQADQIMKSFTKARTLNSFFQLAAVGEDIEKIIGECTISLNLLSHFNSTICADIVSGYNSALDEVIEKSRELFGIVAAQKNSLGKAIRSYESEINTFLCDGGYPYTVKIVTGSSSACKVELVHRSNFTLNNTDGALSFGERNALALVFFMYSALSSNPDLIILDDPITSFDGRKRYAILNMLFLKEGGSSCLKNKTVLLLTHEYQIVFDIEHTKKRSFQPLASTTLISNRSGSVTENVITSKDMIPVHKLYEELARNSEEILVRLAYCRMIAELNENHDSVWDVLSSLFHHKSVPSQKKGTPISGKDLEIACSKISRQIDCDFNYEEQRKRLMDDFEAKTIFDRVDSNYEKLQIARLVLDGKNVTASTKRVLDEALHVNNGFVYQLDPREYDLVPDGLIDQCSHVLDSFLSA